MAPKYTEIKFSVGDFDEIWNHLPHVSLYQIRILVFAGYLGIISGLLDIFPVFAQYAPETRCESVFDANSGREPK